MAYELHQINEHYSLVTHFLAAMQLGPAVDRQVEVKESMMAGSERRPQREMSRDAMMTAVS